MFLQECCAIVLSKSVLPDCQISVSCQGVPQLCPVEDVISIAFLPQQSSTYVSAFGFVGFILCFCFCSLVKLFCRCSCEIVKDITEHQVHDLDGQSLRTPECLASADLVDVSTGVNTRCMFRIFYCSKKIKSHNRMI